MLVDAQISFDEYIALSGSLESEFNPFGYKPRLVILSHQSGEKKRQKIKNCGFDDVVPSPVQSKVMKKLLNKMKYFD